MCGARRRSGNSEEKNLSPVRLSNQIPRSLNQQPCHCIELQQLGDDEHEGHLAIMSVELK